MGIKLIKNICELYALSFVTISYHFVCHIMGISYTFSAIKMAMK